MWKIFYGDGSTRDDTEGLPVTADEKLNIICIVQHRNPELKHILHGGNYYIFTGAKWVQCDFNGLEDYAMNVTHEMKCVLKGRSIDHQKFIDIYERAKEYKDQP